MGKIACEYCGEKFSSKYIEEHHTSYNPPIKVNACRKCHRKIHGNEVIEGELTLIMRQYNTLVKLGAGIKQRKQSWEREFGNFQIPLYNEFLASIEKEKKVLLKEAKLVMGKEYFDLQKKWKGIGPVIIAQLLAFAHPKRFSSLRRFLYYCGRKGAAKKNKNYRRVVSATAFQAAKRLLMGRNKKYRKLYDEIKESITEDYREELEVKKAGTKAKIHGKTMNRISTLWLKEFYKAIWEYT